MFMNRMFGKLLSITLIAVLALTALIAGIVPAAPHAAAAAIGNVEMTGDSTFDSDSLADSSGSQYRWHSYPGARLTLNANQASDVKAPAGPIDYDLTLQAGGWFGSNAVNLNNLVKTQIAPYGGTENSASSYSTTWYPYKIAFSGSYPTVSGTTVSGYDTMINDNSSMLRVINVNSSIMNEVVLKGFTNASGGLLWVGGTDKVILASDSKYYYAIHVVSLDGPDLEPVELLETAAISGNGWEYRKAFDGNGVLGVGIGISAASEGSSAAISRALAVFNQPVADTMDAVKGQWDDWLQSVPAPANWGISGIDAHGVTSSQHKFTYYAAWAFILQDLIKALPEKAGSYPYPQMVAGKPSLWNLGDSANSGTSQWESVFGYQMLAYLMPETAWQAFLGLLTTVDGSGMMGGESLPTRIAQTAWMLYGLDPDIDNLEDAYPDIKQHLLWAADNPRWICCGHNITEEKDTDFIASWMFDVTFAIQIAQELGETADVTMWQAERSALLSHAGDWFFPESDVFYGVYYDYTAIDPAWAVGNDRFKAQMLVVSDLSATYKNRLKSWYMSIHRPDDALANFAYHKYPNTTLIVNGLLNEGGGLQAKEMAEASLRDVIRAKAFGEAIIPTASGVTIESVVPSLFTAVEAVHMTWLLNNMQPDYGAPQSLSFGNAAWDAPNSPDAFPLIEDFTDIGDWENTYNSFVSALGGSGLFRYIDVVGDSYGMAEKQVAYNVDQFPKITIKVAELYNNAQWALKVNDGGVDVQLQGTTSQTGEFTYDLKQATGWSGSKTFKIRLYVLNGDVKVTEIGTQYHTLDNFSSVTDWSDTWNASISASSGIATVATTSAYGQAKRSFHYNVNEYPYLKIKVPEVGSGAQWALKVNDGSGDITLQSDTNTTGELVYDLKAITGWSGTKTFDILLYAIGGSGKLFKVDYLNLPVHIFEDFSSVGSWQTPVNATLSASSGIATLTATASSGKAARTVAADTTRYFKLAVTVTQVSSGASWSLKVDDGSGETTLESGSTATGTFTYDLGSATGWSGKKKYDVILYVNGGSGKFVKFDDLRMVDIV